MLQQIVPGSRLTTSSAVQLDNTVWVVVSRQSVSKGVGSTIGIVLVVGVQLSNKVLKNSKESGDNATHSKQYPR